MNAMNQPVTEGWSVIVIKDLDESQNPPATIQVRAGKYSTSEEAKAAGERECTQMGGIGFFIQNPSRSRQPIATPDTPALVTTLRKQATEQLFKVDECYQRASALLIAIMNYEEGHEPKQVRKIFKHVLRELKAARAWADAYHTLSSKKPWSDLDKYNALEDRFILVEACLVVMEKADWISTCKESAQHVLHILIEGTNPVLHDLFRHLDYGSDSQELKAA